MGSLLALMGFLLISPTASSKRTAVEGGDSQKDGPSASVDGLLHLSASGLSTRHGILSPSSSLQQVDAARVPPVFKGSLWAKERRIPSPLPRTFSPEAEDPKGAAAAASASEVLGDSVSAQRAGNANPSDPCPRGEILAVNFRGSFWASQQRNGNPFPRSFNPTAAMGTPEYPPAFEVHLSSTGSLWARQQRSAWTAGTEAEKSVDGAVEVPLTFTGSRWAKEQRSANPFPGSFKPAMESSEESLAMEGLAVFRGTLQAARRRIATPVSGAFSPDGEGADNDGAGGARSLFKGSLWAKEQRVACPFPRSFCPTQDAEDKASAAGVPAPPKGQHIIGTSPWSQSSQGDREKEAPGVSSTGSAPPLATQHESGARPATPLRSGAAGAAEAPQPPETFAGSSWAKKQRATNPFPTSFKPSGGTDDAPVPPADGGEDQATAKWGLAFAGSLWARERRKANPFSRSFVPADDEERTMPNASLWERQQKSAGPSPRSLTNESFDSDASREVLTSVSQVSFRGSSWAHKRRVSSPFSKAFTPSAYQTGMEMQSEKTSSATASQKEGGTGPSRSEVQGAVRRFEASLSSPDPAGQREWDRRPEQQIKGHESPWGVSAWIRMQRDGVAKEGEGEMSVQRDLIDGPWKTSAWANWQRSISMSSVSLDDEDN